MHPQNDHQRSTCMSASQINSGISDEELVILPVGDLNRHFKIIGLTREEITLMKQRYDSKNNSKVGCPNSKCF